MASSKKRKLAYILNLGNWAGKKKQKENLPKSPQDMGSTRTMATSLLGTINSAWRRSRSYSPFKKTQSPGRPTVWELATQFMINQQPASNEDLDFHGSIPSPCPF